MGFERTSIGNATHNITTIGPNGEATSQGSNEIMLIILTHSLGLVELEHEGPHGAAVPDGHVRHELYTTGDARVVCAGLHVTNGCGGEVKHISVKAHQIAVDNLRS